jgi:heme/copper-type cytochrome/quinol oxidase subunit 2
MKADAENKRSGQVMLEYAIVAGILVGVLAMLALFLFTFKEQGARIMDLISADFP